MKICLNGHDEIVYEGRTCPFCEEIFELTLTVAELEKAVDELKVLNEQSKWK